MSETLAFPKTEDRAEIYSALLPQIEALISGESDLVANQANIVAALKEAFNFFWVGFYWAKGGELVLGPFQGPVACTRIAFNRGVCGHAYQTKKTVIVDDVSKFPGHIACSALTQSEIVVPVFDSERNVIGVLDVDSHCLADFSNKDLAGLERIVEILGRSL